MSPSSRVRRTVAGVTVLLLSLGLAGCGNGDSEGDTGGGLDQVSVTGDFGKAPTYEWDDRVEVTESQSKVLIEGDGDEVAMGDSVFTHLSLANGYDKTEVYSDFAEAEQLFTVSAQGLPGLVDGVVGQRIGSRVLLALPPDEAFGEEGNPTLGIGNDDSVVIVVDLLEKLPAGPEGKQVDPASWMPAVTETDGLPTELDFTGTPKPSDRTRLGYLIKGTGPKVAKGDHLFVNYLGQVYDGKAPFDASYQRGVPLDFEIGTEPPAVIVGWDSGLRGVPVGSRVMLAVPPADGYGKKGNADAGIKGTDTLYFVIDVLAAR